MIDIRKYEYGKCAAALKDARSSAGVEALFDQAVTNGLLAIVAREWRGQEVYAPKNGRPAKLKSASDLLKVVAAEAKEARPGEFEFPINDGLTSRPFCVRVTVLLDGINRAQVIRHGRIAPASSADLIQVHIDALCALDEHPSLGTLDEGERDRSWIEAKVFDLWSRRSAEDYLMLMSDAEIERRAEIADERSSAPGDVGGPFIQDCPVCQRKSFIARILDGLGNNVGVGTCLVCAYARSEIIADDEAMQIEWEARWETNRDLRDVTQERHCGCPTQSTGD